MSIFSETIKVAQSTRNMTEKDHNLILVWTNHILIPLFDFNVSRAARIQLLWKLIEDIIFPFCPLKITVPIDSAILTYVTPTSNCIFFGGWEKKAREMFEPLKPHLLLGGHFEEYLSSSHSLLATLRK